MTCESCGDKPKKCNKDFTRAVVEIDNPEQITLMRKVTIPASMGDDTTVPPVVGKYKNVLLYYEANSKTYLYSSDGIPTQLVNGVTDYEAAVNLPQINGHTLLGNKTGDQLGLQNKLTAGDNISIDSDNVISAVDTTYGPATDTEIGLVKPGDGLNVDTDGTLGVNIGDGLNLDSDNKVYTIKYIFDTVDSMKASTDLKDGDYARTLGYYAKEDSGDALYLIREKTDSDVENDGSIIFIANDLVAELTVLDRQITTKQFACKGDGTTNDTAHLQACLDFIKQKFPDGCILKIVGQCLSDASLELKGTNDAILYNIVITSIDGGTSGYNTPVTTSNGIIINAEYGDSASYGIVFDYIYGLVLESIFVTSTENVANGDLPFNYTIGVRLTNSSMARINYCNITKFHTGLSSYGAGLLYIEKNNFARCNIGCMLQELGDCTLVGNYFNTNGWNIREEDGTIKSKYADIGHNIYGLGLWCGSVGMINIVGGKCEWNNDGFHFEHCGGVNICNINFDYNVVCHIGIAGMSPLPRDCTFNIANNQFISGCWCTTGSYLSGASIALWRATGVSITGNSFEADSKSHYRSFSGTNPYYGPTAGFIRCRHVYNSSVTGNTFDRDTIPVYGSTAQLIYSGNSGSTDFAYSNSIILMNDRNVNLSQDTWINFLDGTFEAGDRVTKKTDSTDGWKCTDSGSYGTMDGTTCTVIDSDITVNTTPIPGDKTIFELGGNMDPRIHTGSYVEIAGVTGVKRITELLQLGYSNTRVFCRVDSPCDVAVTDAALSFHTPTFTTI